MSKDIIYREDAIKVIDDVFDGIPMEQTCEILKVRKTIRELPSADRPQGKWIPCTKSGLPLTELMRREGQKWYGYKCSNCNHIYKGNALTDCNYCPNCGADMRGKDDEYR